MTKEEQALADYQAAKLNLADAAVIAAAGPSLIRFSDGETFPTGLATIEAFPDQFGEGARPSYAFPISFAAEAEAATVTEAWLIGEAGAALVELPEPLQIGGGIEGGTDPVVIAAASLDW